MRPVPRPRGFTMCVAQQTLSFLTRQSLVRKDHQTLVLVVLTKTTKTLVKQF